MASAQKHDIGDYRIDSKSDQNAEISILVALCLFSIFLLAAFVTTQNRDVLVTELTTFFTEISKDRHRGFQIGSLDLGGSVQSHRALYPGSSVSINTQGHTFLSFEDSGTTYSAWYSGEENQRAFRTRMDTTFEGKADDDAVNEITMRFGPPSVRDCENRMTTGVMACNYSWWLPSDIRLDMASRAPLNNSSGTKKGDLTTVATDTRLMAQIRRAEQALELNAARRQR